MNRFFSGLDLGCTTDSTAMAVIEQKDPNLFRHVEPDDHVLVVEDVWTTGGSTYATIRVLEEAGARVVAAGALIEESFLYLLRPPS